MKNENLKFKHLLTNESEIPAASQHQIKNSHSIDWEEAKVARDRL